MTDFFEQLATDEYKEAIRMIDETSSEIEKPTGSLMEELIVDVQESAEEQFKRMGWKKENITPVQANVYLENYNHLMKEIDEIQKTVENYLQFHSSLAIEWQKKEVLKRVLQSNYYKEMLQAYADRELDGSNKKSVNLISGKIGYRKPVPTYEYEDDVLFKYLQDNSMNKYLKPQPPKVDKKLLKKDGVIEADGIYIGDEKVPGVKVSVKDSDVFYIK